MPYLLLNWFRKPFKSLVKPYIESRWLCISNNCLKNRPSIFQLQIFPKHLVNLLIVMVDQFSTVYQFLEIDQGRTQLSSYTFQICSHISIIIFIQNWCLILFLLQRFFSEKIGEWIEVFNQIPMSLESVSLMNLLFAICHNVRLWPCLSFMLVFDGPKLFYRQSFIVSSGMDDFWHQQWL